MLSASLTQYLKTWMSSGSVQPPLLLVGSPEITTKAAKFIAQTVLCEAKGTAPCTVCVACKQVEAGIYPDFVHYTEDEPHTIALVRAIEEKLARRPLHGTQVIILPALEKMSIPASQALLKTLEEPPQTTRFILTSSYPRRLLPTILSRSTRFTLEQSSTPATHADLNTEDIDSIKNFLTYRLEKNGPSPELRRSFQRLRDYYKITALKGNSKLAKEVLVASLAEIRYI